MASIKQYPAKSGPKGKLWRVQYRGPDGRSRTKSGFRTKADAETWASGNTVAISQGEWIAPEDTKTTVADLWPRWWKSQHKLAASSKKALETSWNIHVKPQWGATPVVKIGAADIQDWVDTLAKDKSATIVHRAYGLLRSLLADAVRFRKLRRTPCVDMRLPAKGKKKMVALTRAQVDLLAATTKRHHGLVLTLGYTGMRWSEAVALTVGDIDLEAKRASITKAASTVGGKVIVSPYPKDKRHRRVAIPDVALAEIKKDMKDKLPTALLWTAHGGGYLTTPSRRSWWHSAVDACREKDKDFPPVSPHDLRHAAASMLIAAGASVMVVSSQLGHQSAKRTLDVYSHLMGDELDSVVDLLGVVKMS